MQLPSASWIVRGAIGVAGIGWGHSRGGADGSSGGPGCQESRWAVVPSRHCKGGSPPPGFSLTVQNTRANTRPSVATRVTITTRSDRGVIAAVVLASQPQLCKKNPTSRSGGCTGLGRPSGKGHREKAIGTRPSGRGHRDEAVAKLGSQALPGVVQSLLRRCWTSGTPASLRIAPGSADPP